MKYISSKYIASIMMNKLEMHQKLQFALTWGVSSVIGIFSGSPYVAHVLEYINFCTPCFTIAFNTVKLFDVILW